MENTSIESCKAPFMVLLGSPVNLSKSPLMHNTAFEELNLDYRYYAIDATEETLPVVVEKLKAQGAVGWNCTMPVKTKMYELCDELSTSAKLMKAVNTVVYKDGKIIGHNTDGFGFVNAVASVGFPVKGRTLTILGTGGAAKAMITQSALDGAKEIFVFGRPGMGFNAMREMLISAKENTNCKITLLKYDNNKLNECISKSDILANATKVGLNAPNVCVLTDFSALKRNMLVFDAIYEPEMTLLLKKAHAAGSKILNGADMLFYQGAEAFKIWTGKEMPIHIKELVEN